MSEKLGRFGHHPDPATDFCVEVDAIEGMARDAAVGLIDCADVQKRVDRAMQFTVGGDPLAVSAKYKLRGIELAIAPVA